MLHVALFVLMGRLVGAIKEMLIAWRYGISPEIDAYIFLFNIVNWPISLWLSLLTASLVPVLSRANGGPREESYRFHAELLGRTVLLGSLTAALLAMSMVLLLGTSFSGLSSPSIAAAWRMVVPMTVLLPIGTLIGLFSVMMLARARHSSTLLECVPASIVGLSVAMLGGFGIEALTWGTLVGFICHAATLGFLVRGEFDGLRLSGHSGHWPALWKGFGIMLIGQILMSLTGLIDQFFVTRLYEGALSTLGYAQRILSLIIGLGATVVGRATIPVLARAQQDGQVTMVKRLTLHWTIAVTLSGIVAAAAAWWFAPTLVRALFERGAFTPEDTEAVVRVFRWGTFQLPFNFAAVILFYALAGQHRFWLLMTFAAVAIIVKVLANLWLVTDLGLEGILLSTALMYAMLAGLYLVAFCKPSGATQ